MGTSKASRERGKEGAKKLLGKAELPMENKDLTAARYEFLIRFPFVEGMLHDPEDAPVLQALLNILVGTYATFGALIAAVLTPECPTWVVHVLGVVHLLNLYVMWIQRFVLALHYASHRRLFRRSAIGNFLNTWFASFIMCIPFGIPPGTYELHHIAMHHVENNRPPEDMTATMQYQRDHWLSFWTIWLMYPINTPVHLVRYGWKTGRYDAAIRLAICMPLYLLSGIPLFVFGYISLAMYLIYGPFLLTSVALMFGNFSQHIFVNPDDPDVNTYNLINTPENQVTFNDGYHQVHHDVSTLHWAKMPTYFMEHIAEYAARDVFLFHSLGFADVGLHVMTGRLERLAKFYVHYGQTPEPRTQEEIVAEFRRRLAPIPIEPTPSLEAAVATPVSPSKDSETVELVVAE